MSKETIKLDDLDEIMFGMNDEELYEFFLLIHSVENKVVDEMKKRLEVLDDL